MWFNIRSFTYVGAHTYQTTYLTFGGCLGIVLTPNSKPQTSSVGGIFQGGAPSPTGGRGSTPAQTGHITYFESDGERNARVREGGTEND